MKSAYSYISTHRRFLLILCLSVALFSLFSVTAFAQSPQERAEEAGWIASALDGVGDVIAGIIYTIALSIGGLFTGIGGLLLDTVVYETILQGGYWLSPDQSFLGAAISDMWQVIRDILNILFIFSFIYIGIKTILDSNSSETQRRMGMLIIAALLVNFSLFFTQVIVDFSNIAAIQVHNLIATGLGDGATTGDTVFGRGSIAGGFINVASLSSFFWFDSDVLSEMDFTRQIAYSMMMMVFLIIAGIVLGLAAILLIRRFITLVLCMIFAPIMFAGWILPAFSEQQEEWRGKLLMNAFFAPAFFFMVYLSLTVLDTLRRGIFGDAEIPGYSELMRGADMDINSFTIVFFFCLAIGFLWASIKVGEMMSISGARGAMKITQKAIGGATVGLAARAGRASAGRYAQYLSEKDSLKDAASQGGATGYLARAALKGTRVVGDSNFDARSQGFGGHSMGDARKGGYKTVTAEIEKKEKQFAESLGEIAETDPRVKAMLANEHHLQDELTELKRQREDASKEDKASFDLLIAQKQDEIKREKEAIIHEKNRRQIGAYVVPAETPGYTEAANARIAAKATFDESIATIDQEKRRLAQAVKVINDDLARNIEAQQLVADDTTRTDAERQTARAAIAVSKQTARAAIDTAETNARTVIDTARNTAREAARTIKEQNKVVKDMQKEGQAAAADQGYAGVLESSTRLQSLAFARNKNQDHAAGKAIRKQYKKGRLKEEAHGADDHGGGHGDDHGGGDHGGGHH